MYPPPDVVRDVRGIFMDRGLVVWKMTVEKADLVKLRFPEYPMFLLYLLKLQVRFHCFQYNVFSSVFS